MNASASPKKRWRSALLIMVLLVAVTASLLTAAWLYLPVLFWPMSVCSGGLPGIRVQIPAVAVT